MPLNIVFAGTPPIAAVHLQALLDAGYSVIAAYTQPDRPAGRGKKLQPSPVKTLALEHGIPVFQPLNFRNPDDIATLAALQPDVMVVVAYGLLLPTSVLEIPAHGCINVHASLLPRWRGAAPIERAIEAGDALTGITIMQMDAGLDTGDMLVVRPLSITAATTGDSLREQMGITGSEALVEALQQIGQGKTNPVAQDNALANYASKLTKEEALIDWRQPASAIDRKIRAFTSANVCQALYEGDRIKVWQALPLAKPSGQSPGEILAVSRQGITVACGEGALQLQALQLPNGKRMDVAAILNGKKDLFVAGKHFG